MPPVRRYLRITKYSILECRIYLDHPADGPRWLLHPRDPALPRIMQSIKPLVLPKLREERDRAREKGKKQRSVKDVVVEDDFEVSIYLTETGTRHSLLTKSKTFKDSRRKTRKELSALNGDSSGDGASPMVIREESDEEAMDLSEIPHVDESYRQRKDPVEIDSDSSKESDELVRLPSEKTITGGSVDGGKKKLHLNTSYEGFSIYGRILCLIVTRRNLNSNGPTNSEVTGQEMMKDWIASTQAPKETSGD